MTEVEYREIGGRKYELKLEQGSDPDWPWFVNAYDESTRGSSLYMPAWFCAGKTKEDAINRVTKNLLEKQ
jgi:hypothetical protein